MLIEQSFTLPLPPAQAWPAFRNAELLVECLPGASLTGPAVDGELPLRFDVKLGPIAAGFIGAGRVSFDDPAQTGRFEGQAADKRSNSRVRGAATFSLRPVAAGTQVEVAVDYTLTGSLAQFSRGVIVRELASALTAQFASNLAVRLRSDPATDSPALTGHVPADSTSRISPAPGAAPMALDAWSLIKRALLAKWASWRHG